MSAKITDMGIACDSCLDEDFFKINNDMNLVNTIMERDILINTLNKNIENQKKEIKQLKKDKHKLRQEKAMLKWKCRHL